ncbi:MAG TPA: DUF1800 domain-containing protein [Terriglobia bacterium]|nr:DUF1800 domain-containing protein [Terriglobia bacterium]
MLKRIAASSLLGVMAASLVVMPLNGADETAYQKHRTAEIQAEKWRQPLSQRQKAELLLSRITFGARPGDVDRVLQMGLNNFLDQQLHPRALDDSALEAKLQDLQILRMPSAELAEDFPPPMQAKRREQRRLAALEQQNRQPDSGQMAAQNSGLAQATDQSPSEAPVQTPDQNAMQAQTGRPGEPAPAGKLQGPQEPQGPREILLQLSQEEMLRAVYSKRQLQEVMVHFWMNHFNVYWPKGADRYYLTSFEQNVIRPHAMGNFEDLLVATAESPAMLFYLDNWMSVSPDQAAQQKQNLRPAFRPFGPFGPRRFPQQAQRSQKAKNKRGLNENYGRELMELHTIGLNYTQQDVTEVARCFTGWTIQRPGQGGAFYFNLRLHDYGKKVVLGYTIPAGQGIEDGFEVLHILAMNPHTADHIAYELCQRFVADNPPPELVDHAAKTYLATQGDIPSVLKTILTSPEFCSEGAYQAKVKSPFEYVASALRALDAQTDGGQPLFGAMSQMGEPMFMYEAPSGYDDVASTWINSSALLMRMNFAIGLCLGRIRGTDIDWQAFTREESGQSARQTINRVAEQLTGGSLSSATETTILDKLTNGDPADWGQLQPGQQTRMIAGLMLASPEFQKR